MRDLEFLKAHYAHHTPDIMGLRRRYAVLCPFVEVEGEAHILFEVRAKGVRQPGEVCFPGGRMEAGETVAECALRETEEELSIPRAAITLFGQSDFQAGRDGSVIRPVLGEISPEGLAALNPSKGEVAEVFTVPVAFFAANPPKVYTYTLEPQMPPDFPYEDMGIDPSYPWRGGRMEVPVWHYEGRIIWGLTGRILKDIFGH